MARRPLRPELGHACADHDGGGSPCCSGARFDASTRRHRSAGAGVSVGPDAQRFGESRGFDAHQHHERTDRGLASHGRRITVVIIRDGSHRDSAIRSDADIRYHSVVRGSSIARRSSDLRGSVGLRGNTGGDGDNLRSGCTGPGSGSGTGGVAARSDPGLVSRFRECSTCRDSATVDGRTRSRRTRHR